MYYEFDPDKNLCKLCSDSAHFCACTPYTPLVFLLRIAMPCTASTQTSIHTLHSADTPTDVEILFDNKAAHIASHSQACTHGIGHASMHTSEHPSKRAQSETHSLACAHCMTQPSMRTLRSESKHAHVAATAWHVSIASCIKHAYVMSDMRTCTRCFTQPRVHSSCHNIIQSNIVSRRYSHECNHFSQQPSMRYHDITHEHLPNFSPFDEMHKFCSAICWSTQVVFRN